MNLSNNVTNRLVEVTPAEDGGWLKRNITTPSDSSLTIATLHDPLLADSAMNNKYLIQDENFISPKRLQVATAGSDERTVLKMGPAFFDSKGMKTEQRFATSKDGTRVPYFIVWPKGARVDGANPTLLYGYGGFGDSQFPVYSAYRGISWNERGGVYVVANIRGGGEYGPSWHQAAVKSGKQKSFDDFIAVAEHLQSTNVTNPRQLGIEGGSNGGLLVAAVMVQRPELFNAVICEAPLLDMRRYTMLPPGASWKAEYGDPDDPTEWEYIAKYSPYQNVNNQQTMPRVFFNTSKNDDRVHPGHARKMAARMIEQGHDVLFYESTEGGHAGNSTNEQSANELALQATFLWKQLGDG